MQVMSKTGVFFMHEGVDGLLRDKTRPPGKRPLPGETVRRVVNLTLAAPPGETTHWTGWRRLEGCYPRYRGLRLL
jgi:hypothetical protein